MTFAAKKMAVARSKISEIYLKEHLREENQISPAQPCFSSLKHLSYLKEIAYKTIINPLIESHEYKRYNMIPGRTVLLCGAKNIGKKFFVRSLCVEHKINFLDCFIDTEKDVCDVYKKAINMEPCIVFVSNQIKDDKEKVFYEISRKLEDVSGKQVSTIFSCLSKASAAVSLLKMINHEITMTVPDEKARKQILESFNFNNFENVNINELAKLTPGYFAIDLYNLCVSAVSSAIVRKKTVEMDDILANIISSNAVTMDDVGALAEVKREIEMNIILPLQFPKKFRRLGISKTPGILLHGPPGCGKTMLAKAISNSLLCNFMCISGPELINKYVGDTEKEMRDIFEKARNQEPCVLFFDEIDSLCGHRGNNDFQTRVVNQMLTLLDGMDDKGNIFIIGATNRIEALDTAILRPGRFDKIIEVPLPTHSEQIDIFKKCTRAVPVEAFNFETINMDGFTGADIACLVREAALFALKENFTSDNLIILAKHFHMASDVLQQRKKMFG